MFTCSHCNVAYPDQGIPYRCPQCGGTYDCPSLLYRPGISETKVNPGIWRYKDTFGLPDQAPEISLGEGNTPLVWENVSGYNVAFKCEFQNPTGSFKDRGSATLVSFLRSRGVVQAIEDSSGNAGASLAAYAARAGIKIRIYIPQSATEQKRQQISAYGAEVVRVPGPRSNAAESVRQAAANGMVYASHAYLPFNIPGYATLAYEITEQLGEAPGTLICPVGQGGLLLGAARGFSALISAGKIHRYPQLVGVQARVCAPLYERYMGYKHTIQNVGEGVTLAEGVKIMAPVRAEEVYLSVKESQGQFIGVAEVDIIPGRDELAHRGFYVEITSAIVWNALSQLLSNKKKRMPEPIVVVLTGSGLKTS
jgi:threonine synthase